jgi:4-hydroxybenzoate polyprenyltransferase
MRSDSVAAQSAAGVMGGASALLECMRPTQWIKNGFVLAPVIFSAHLTDNETLLRSAVAFGVFCLAASGIYLWNDCMDAQSDAEHPQKRTRPIPSGRLNAIVAAMTGAMLVLVSLAGAFSLNRATGILLSTYVAVNFLYTGWLKHTVILDVMCIAIGFVVRVMAGATAITVEASHWLLLCTFLLALFLGIAKRRNEIVVLAGDSGKHRRVLAEYSLPWLDQAGTLVAGAAVVAYALYTVAPETQIRFGTKGLIYTVPLVIYGILRYLHLIHASGNTGNPTSALITDRQLLSCVTGWGVACALIIYTRAI